MKDPIQFLLDSQKKFQESLGNLPDLSNEKAVTYFIRDQVIYTMDELSEMMRELPFNKSWKNYDEFDREKHKALAKEEYIDALHFFINIGVALEMTEQDIIEEYCKKHAINYKRQQDGYGFNDTVGDTNGR